MNKYIRIKGKVVKGLGKATKYLPIQKPFFRLYKIDGLENFRDGTINIKPDCRFTIKDYDYLCPEIEWRPLGPETFGFIKVKLIWQGKKYKGYIYRPFNSTNNSKGILEILTKNIPGIKHSQKIELEIPKGKLELYKFN